MCKNCTLKTQERAGSEPGPEAPRAEDRKKLRGRGRVPGSQFRDAACSAGENSSNRRGGCRKRTESHTGVSPQPSQVHRRRQGTVIIEKESWAHLRGALRVGRAIWS